MLEAVLEYSKIRKNINGKQSNFFIRNLAMSIPFIYFHDFRKKTQHAVVGVVLENRSVQRDFTVVNVAY